MAKKTAKTKATTSKANGGASTAVGEALALLTAAKAALVKVGLTSLTAAQRQDSNGKLRVGEAAAMGNVLDTMDAYPGVVASLADKDGGTDPDVVETAPARADLALWSELAPVADAIEAIRTLVSDTMIASAEAAKAVTVPGYAILRANAPANASIARVMKPAITFFGHPAKQRAANLEKVARVAKKSATSKTVATA